MGAKKSKEVQVLNRGSPDASHFILIEFCGGWGYYKHASLVAERIEAKHPNMFRFELKKDQGTTGRLEVTIYHHSKDATTADHALVVHQKSKGQGYCHSNWAQFDQRLEEAIAKIPLWWPIPYQILKFTMPYTDIECIQLWLLHVKVYLENWRTSQGYAWFYIKVIYNIQYI